MDDELDDNKFLNILIGKFSNLFNDVQEKQRLVCVPPNASLTGQILDLKFLEFHIFKASPFFQDHYQTINLSGQSGTIKFDKEQQVISTIEGFPKIKDVKILSCEVAYNKDGKPYHMLLLKEPLLPSNSGNVQQISDADSLRQELLKERRKLDEQRELLGIFSSLQPACKKAETEAVRFSKSYMIVPGYFNHAVEKLETVFASSSKELLDALPQPYFNNQKICQAFLQALESLITSLSYEKLFPAVQQEFSREDCVFVNKKKVISSLPPTQLGVPADYCCDMKSCVEIVDQMVVHRTPVEILYEMRDLLDCVSQTVANHVQAMTTSPFRNKVKESPALTTDDLLPLLVVVLSQCRASNLVSVVNYAEKCHWASSGFDRLSFSLVSVKAALHYIETTDFQQTNFPAENVNTKFTPSASPFHYPKSELTLNSASSLDKSRSSILPGSSSDELPVKDQGSSSYHSVLTGVQKLEFNPEKTVQAIKAKESQKKLGSFLASLKDDPLPTIGKKN